MFAMDCLEIRIDQVRDGTSRSVIRDTLLLESHMKEHVR